MQPAPKGRGFSSSGKNSGGSFDIGTNPPKKRPRLVVDPAPNKKNMKLDMKAPVVNPRRKMNVDDKIYRTMPITEKQLGSIKKMYGI
jgi:hypothetical protein